MVSLIFFSTSTCGYCKPIRIILENLKADYEDNNEVEICYIIVDKDPNGMNIAREWHINAVPTILIIVNREEQGRLIGDISREKIVDAIERNLQSDVFSEQSRGSESGSRPLLCDSSKS